MSMFDINRDSPMPVYYQIAINLRHRIARGEWTVGEQLPSEIDLATQYGVSRMTIRQAMADLVKQGVVAKERGSGTFIRKHAPQMAPALGFPISFAHGLRELGVKHTSHILRCTTIPVPSHEVATQLDISDEDDVIYIERIITIGDDDQPIALNHSMLAARRFPDFVSHGLIDQSVSTTLSRRYGVFPTQADHSIESVRASEYEAGHLDIESDAPLLLLTTISRTDDFTPVEYSMTWWVGDRMRLRFHAEVQPYELLDQTHTAASGTSERGV